MPDYNPAVALGLHPPENSLAQTFNTIANLQQSQAHTGLYTLQAAQQQRDLDAKRAYADTISRGGSLQDAAMAAVRRGGNTSDVNQLLQASSLQTELDRGGGLRASAIQEFSGAAKNRAETSNLGVQYGILQTERAKKDMEYRGSTAQSLFADPSDENWKANVPNLRGHVSPQGQAQIDAAMKDPSLRPRVAQSMIAAAMPTAEATGVHPTTGAQGMTTPLGELARNIPQPGGGAAPAAGRAPMPPSVVEEQKQRGEYLGKLPGKLTEEANNAKMQSYILDQMKQESQSWDMGKGADTMMKASQYMKPIANVLGSNYFDKPVADYEAFVKNSGTLVRTAVKEVSSRAAVQEFNLIAKQLPEPTMSRQGFYNIADQFHSVNDFKQAKEIAGSAWGRGHGTMEGFEADWNKNITPTAFLVHRMSPEQLHKTLDGLQAAGPEGKAAIQSIKQQMQYANQSGLF